MKETCRMVAMRKTYELHKLLVRATSQMMEPTTTVGDVKKTNREIAAAEKDLKERYKKLGWNTPYEM